MKTNMVLCTKSVPTNFSQCPAERGLDGGISMLMIGTGRREGGWGEENDRPGRRS